MRIPIENGLHLAEFRATDKAACVALIREPEIYRGTLRIPRPYEESHFDEWLASVAATTERYGEPVQFAVRDGETFLGSIGLGDLRPGHRAELGYWLGKRWWGRGIMTAVVAAVCRHAMLRWQLVRITASVFSWNTASARVLEKNGFEYEGLLRKHHQKDGEFLDSKLYALVR